MEGKKFTPNLEGETNDDNGLRLYWCNCNIYSAVVPYGYTVECG